jgi:VanZ family protein
MRTIARALFWLTLCAVAFVTLAPLEFRPISGLPPQVERFGSYLATSLLFAVGYPRHRGLGFCALLLVAGLLEVLQELVPGRDARLIDFGAKAAGALAGILLAIGADRMFGKAGHRRG